MAGGCGSPLKAGKTLKGSLAPTQASNSARPTAVSSKGLNLSGGKLALILDSVLLWAHLVKFKSKAPQNQTISK